MEADKLVGDQEHDGAEDETKQEAEEEEKDDQAKDGENDVRMGSLEPPFW